ncbi:MAG: PAS domain S-box protein [Syntrophaceae bacterium]|nr:PAS domain S-box protein [Syntrophaceae bacterium]MBP9531677.1 PAS domain S-box protein [Syntrophaceae bacterium]MBP9649704.1 PAS domain S-box protein [Syntrophaceae bacterium]
MADLFSRQQLASAQNASARMTEILSQVERNVALFSYFDPNGKILSPQDHRKIEILYSVWGKTIDAVLVFDAQERVRRVLSQDALPRVNLIPHFQALKSQKRQYLNLALAAAGSGGSPTQKQDWYLIWGYPIWREGHIFDGAWMVSFSLAALVHAGERQIQENRLGDLWLINDRGQIIMHPHLPTIGKNTGDLIHDRRGNAIAFSPEGGRHIDAKILQRSGSPQRSVIAYYPFQVAGNHWFVMVSAPYAQVVAPVRTTFLYTMFSAFVLMLILVIVGIFYAFREGRRLRMREVQERLKERETWQEKLLREKKTIEGIIEGSPIPSFVINKEHQVILWNRACVELTGQSAEDTLGTDGHYRAFYPVKRPMVADLIIDADIDALNKYYSAKQVKKSEKVLGAYEAYDYYENLGGRSRYMYFLAAPIYDEDGNIIAAIETLQDISREQELTRSLQEYAETLQNELAENIELRKEIEGLLNYMQSIVRSLPDKIYELDQNGIITFISWGLKKPKSELRGKHFLEFVAPENADFVVSRWEDAKQGIYTPYEIETVAKDGHKVNLMITTSPVIGTDHYILVQRDITEFKNLEKKLYSSQKLAALGQLSAGIAHEIRNPLSSIKMSLQILEKRIKPEGNDLKRFKIAQKEVEHLEELVNNVLVFAKPMEPKIESVDLTKVLEQAVALSEQIIHDKKIEVTLETRDAPAVNVDVAMITDAFVNVIRNAVEAMEEGGHIHIYARSIGSRPPSVLVVVEDDGCGIDDADMPHLYNPFFTKKKYGTGLGLSQVLKIVEVHQGKLEIISEKGKGTKVCVTLPCNK